MYADPKVGDYYYQEYFLGEAEDVGEIVGVNQSVTVPAGSFSGCIEVRETTPLQPEVLEHKHVCPGVGTVLTIDVAGGNLRRGRIAQMPDLCTPHPALPGQLPVRRGHPWLAADCPRYRKTVR